jgi:DNA-binding transcriptional LysR family regulator
MQKSDLPDLAAFVTVVEERSFTRAAVRLGVSQSALSHSMRSLEKRMGVQLMRGQHAAFQQQRQAQNYYRNWRLLWKGSDAL